MKLPPLFIRSTSLTLSIMTLALGACGEKTKETLGLSRRTPDAFAVVTRAPLELPPDYALRPPVPGAERPQEIQPSDQAAQALLGNPKNANIQSKAETAILNKTGADQVPTDIRAVITSEQSEDTDNNTPIGRKLLGLGSTKDTNIINPVDESKRLEAEKSTKSVPQERK